MNLDRLVLPALAIGVAVFTSGFVNAALHKPIISQIGKVFSPGEVTMPVGATIRIDNDDDVPHSLILSSPDGKRANLGTKQPGEATDIPLMQSGDYLARCGIHPAMKLVVRVR